MEITIDDSIRTFITTKYDAIIIEMKLNDVIQLKSFMEIDKDIYENDFKEIFKKRNRYIYSIFQKDLKYVNLRKL